MLRRLFGPHREQASSHIVIVFTDLNVGGGLLPIAIWQATPFP